MGRRKITIKQIVDPKLRHITFNKRKNGLIKKAAELSLLCNVNMLLIFEDGNGNLIQFSKNKLVNMPSFFQECRYSNVVEFVAKDYPNFFKVNHYKKHKGVEDDDYDQDDFDDLSETQPKATLPNPGAQAKSAVKKDRIPGPARIKEEDRNSGRVVFQSGSEESGNEGNDEISPYVSTQLKPHPQPQHKSQIKINTKPARPEEKQKIVTEEELNLGLMNDQEPAPIAPKDSFQTYKDMTPRIRGDKPPVDFAQSFMGLGRAFERPNPMTEQANAFRFYPTDNALNAPNPANNTFVNNPTYTNSHPYIHNGYQAQANSFQNPKNNRMRGFGPLNMGNIPDGEALNAMLKGFPPLGFALGGGNPFMNKPGTKPEMEDQKYLDTANMIKLINGTAGGNPYAGQKIYSFHPNETGKPEDAEQMRGRNDHEGTGYEHEHEYHELPPYVGGGYRMEGNMPPGMPTGMPPGMPSNLPSAYFSSKKFNFDGYFNTFEDERFNEFGDPKKKLKQ